MAFTYFLDNKLLDHIFGGVNYSVPTTLYFGLSTSTPTVEGTNVTEPVGNNYSRVAITNDTTNFSLASNGIKYNNISITYPTSTGAWGTVTHFVIYDALTGGNFLGFSPLNNPQTIETDNTLSFASNAIDFKIL